MMVSMPGTRPEGSAPRFRSGCTKFQPVGTHGDLESNEALHPQPCIMPILTNSVPETKLHFLIAGAQDLVAVGPDVILH